MAIGGLTVVSSALVFCGTPPSLHPTSSHSGVAVGP